MGLLHTNDDADFVAAQEAEAEAWLEAHADLLPPEELPQVESWDAIRMDELAALPESHPDERPEIDLEALSPELRSVVYLYFYEGLTQDQIAVQLGCSQPTVARRLKAALEILRYQIEDSQKSFRSIP